jgi:chloramphenicol-sensitive protein RarD
MVQVEEKKQYHYGLFYAIVCSVLWGFLPIYWQALRPIPSEAIIFYRILLVGIVCFFLSLKLFGWEGIKEPLRTKGVKAKFFIAGVLITANWSIYIWAVNANLVIQTCIGYYVEPLMVCMFGVVLFKEKLTKFKVIALALACVGVIIVLIHFKEIPLVALSIAITFATYAAIKKSVELPSILALFYETMFLMPLALVVIIYFEVTGTGVIGHAAPHQFVLLMMAGFLTALPLVLFGAAASRIPLVTLGIIEYIAPSITLIIGIFLFKEPFDQIQFIAFVVIWIGLIVFTFGEFRANWHAKEDDEGE